MITLQDAIVYLPSLFTHYAIVVPKEKKAKCDSKNPMESNTQNNQSECKRYCSKCKTFCSIKCVGPEILCIPCLCLTLGCNKLKADLWSADEDEEEYKKERDKREKWLIICFLYGPLFCISSHIGYILVAWLTEPDRTTSVALVTLGVIFYLFFVYREICAISSKLPSDGKLQHGCTTCIDYLKNCFCYCCIKKEDKDEDEDVDKDDPPFQLPAFGIALMFSIVIVGPACLCLAVFFLLPIPAIELAINLQNLLQIVIVVSAALISFKILTLGESKQKRFFKKFRHWYYKKNKNSLKNVENGEDIYEDSGRIAGELVQGLAKKYVTPDESGDIQLKTISTSC